MSGARIVVAARDWIGTPYVHQSAVRAAGCDCLGLVRGVWREVYGQEPEAVPAYSMDWSEPQGEERLWDAALRHLRPKEPAQAVAGDVLLFRMRQGAVAKHLGIMSHEGSDARFIHAYSRHGVVENALSAPWRCRVVACFEFPEEIL
ncbi:NlpC/P60 family protein [Sulfitobacter guttiformis]|uniref:NlpC/P60 family putative phage cell wall peptidase n=1 Tax=Sulfitobacter guttiformis TaxID=74349 RepID=A0A420DIR9_9RHOB|nr:NlpC/P60 family protein [Sulfitobacter guttiformis]KIN72110.1 putative phage cell wall peptidase, NlpC/P60 family [Sulfitobacter guttiformis KCTC 32187]RKE94112.1 NlpC/P60 family putative phage cell wall peptidase [Sulfitobacter guttiformis]